MSGLHTSTGTPRVALATGCRENSRQGRHPVPVVGRKPGTNKQPRHDVPPCARGSNSR